MTYVCYRNDRVEFIGSRYEVVEHYGWHGKFNTLHWYTTPAAKRRGRFYIVKVI